MFPIIHWTRTMLFLVGLLSFGVYVAQAFRNGAGDAACTNGLIPQHSPFLAQQEAENPNPYILNVSLVEVLPNQVATVTISGGDSKFEGFMVGVYSSDFFVGSLRPIDNTESKLICNGQAITHTSPTPKSSMSFEWQAPDDPLDGFPVDFIATVVKDYQTFWKDIRPLHSVAVVPPPPDLRPINPGEGDKSDSTTVSSGGVLPTPGTGPPPAENQNPFTTPTPKPSGGHSAGDNQVADWFGVGVAAIIVACLEILL